MSDSSLTSTPVERAVKLCSARGGVFIEELEAHLLRGYVFSTPELFLMGRPVPLGADVSDLSRSWPDRECEAWFVHTGIGDRAALLALMPFPLEYIGWYRQGRNWSENHWVLTRGLQKRVRVST